MEINIDLKKCAFGALLLTLSVHSFAQHNLKKYDSTTQHEITVAANPSLKGNWFKKVFIGENYRREWIQPVQVPFLDLKKQGLKPIKEGGGKETKSLHVEENDGTGWALRSIKKYPEKAVPEALRNTLSEKIVVDDISASYPYGALSMRPLSIAANVPYLTDHLVYLGDDAALKNFRDKYRESLMLMEEKEPLSYLNKKDVKSISTEELIYELQEKNKNQVDQGAVLRARLLDNFVMDFDRHEGQWNWIKKDSGKMNFYFPVPKDRDQVFYTNQGFLPKIVSSKTILPELQGFRAKAKDIALFNRAARNFDHAFLNQTTEEQWSVSIDKFLSSMTDAVIDSALMLQPKEIQNYSAKKIAETLKQKRSFFKKDMMHYYRDLSEDVSVVGSNEAEDFCIKINKDGSVQVLVSKHDSLSSSSVFYNRIFNPAVTKEIDLYGLEGNDSFHIEGKKSKIKIRMIGGPGNDRFINTSNDKKPLVYDVDFENNSLKGKMRNRINSDPMNNVYTRLDYRYRLSTLGPTLELSAINGFFLGLKYKKVTPGFHKEPYSSTHLVSLTHSLSSSSFHFQYNADFINTIGKSDVLIRSDLMLPTSQTNFFGLGNNTLFEKSKHKQDYYHMRYDLGDAALLQRIPIGQWMRFEYGPSFQFLQLCKKENDNKFISTYYPETNYPDDYKRKLYVGGEAHFIIDSRNNVMMPTRGVFFKSYAKTLHGLNAYSNNWSQLGGNFSFYNDFSTKGVIVFATNFGAGHNIGQFEFAQSQFIGFAEHLRGYVVRRFGGRTEAYNQTELRVKLGTINALLARADLGLYGFHDTGRVWADGEQSNIWHTGYGGGVWLAVMKKIVVSGYLSFSHEVKALPWVTIGFEF